MNPQAANELSMFFSDGGARAIRAWLNNAGHLGAPVESEGDCGV